MASDRINKFVEDQTKVLVSSSKPSKIIAEVNHLKQWLQKHQDETVPDGAKGKLMVIMEKYNRAQGYFVDIRDAVVDLYGCYLQLPEGKLVSAKDKAKVLVWVSNISSGEEEDSQPVAPSISKWTVESLDARKRKVTLLSMDDPDLWKEDMAVDDAPTMESIARLMGQGQVVVELEDGSDRIVSVELTS